MKTPNHFLKYIKWLIFLLAYLFLGYKLVTFDSYAELGAYFRSATFEHFLFLIIVFALLPFNLLVEAVKWRKLVSGVQSISLSLAFKSVLVGQTGAFFTPNRLGEFPTRSLLLHKESVAPAVALGFVGSAVQMVVITLFGLLAAYFYRIYQPLFVVHTSLSFWLFFGVILVAIIVLAVWFYRNYALVLTYLHNSKWNWLRLLAQGLSQFSSKAIWHIFALSAIRYAIYSSQFYAMLLFMNVSITPFQALLSIPTIYLFVTYTPSFAFSEAMVRGSYAILILSAFSTNEAGMALAGILLWCVNYCLPMLAGSLVGKKSL